MQGSSNGYGAAFNLHTSTSLQPLPKKLGSILAGVSVAAASTMMVSAGGRHVVADGCLKETNRVP
jgi:hypothetical protein